MLDEIQKKAFKYSGVLHGVLLFCLVLVSVFKSCSWTKTDPIFILEEVPDFTPQGEEKKLQSVPSIQFKTPIVQKPSSNPPVQKLLKPSSLASKEQKPKKVSYADFLKENNKAQSTAQKPEMLNLKTISTSLKNINDKNTSSNLNANKMGAYIYKMKTLINNVWIKPPKEIEGLECTIEFVVEGNGFIKKTTVISSSRNFEFDQSILSAMSRVKQFEATPDKKEYAFQLTFKSVDK